MKRGVLIGGLLVAVWFLAGGEREVPARSPRWISFSLKTWRGEYTTRNIPYGVAASPTRNAAYIVRDDGGGLRKIELGGQDVQHHRGGDSGIE